MARNSPTDHHVAGLYTQMLLKPLIEELSADGVQEMLSRCGETRTLEELCDTSSWSSYEQFRSLLQEARRSLDSRSHPGASGLRSVLIGNTELVETAQAFGSPSSLFSTNSTENPFLPIRGYETTEIDANEWTIREWFIGGFDPYPEFCEFAIGLLAVIPMVFGLPAGDVTEVECQCKGDPACLFRLSWQSDDETSRIEFLEMRTQLLETRLSQVHDMIEDLATNERYEDVLQGIVGSSQRVVGAGGALLALEARPAVSRRIYAQGLTEAEASSLAGELLDGDEVRQEVCTVEVASARRRYGVLAVEGQGGVFASQLRGALNTSARLAAATLDSADALESARREANTAQVLLALTSSLAEIENTDEMVLRVVQAVPALIDCDRVALFLDDISREEPFLDGTDQELPGDRDLRLVASSGYPDEAIATLRSAPFDTTVCADAVFENGVVSQFPSDFGTTAAIIAPIHSAERVIGYMVAGVTSDPERLAITPHLVDRIKGLAAQASISISNAILVDQIRHQAVHDALTGLPNRSLILDRTEQMLARARRSPAPVAALFIDLDGFKDINDTLGHSVGDQVLREVASRLAAAMRASDSVGRLGGDEFVVLVDGGNAATAPEMVAGRLLSVLRAPFEIEGVAGPLTVTASIGIAIGLRPSATELLRDADIALYQAKSQGRDCLSVFLSENPDPKPGNVLRPAPSTR